MPKDISDKENFPDKNGWQEAVQVELKSLTKNQTWEYTVLQR